MNGLELYEHSVSSPACPPASQSDRSIVQAHAAHNPFPPPTHPFLSVRALLQALRSQQAAEEKAKIMWRKRRDTKKQAKEELSALQQENQRMKAQLDNTLVARVQQKEQGALAISAARDARGSPPAPRPLPVVVACTLVAEGGRASWRRAARGARRRWPRVWARARVARVPSSVAQRRRVATYPWMKPSMPRRGGP